MAQRQRVQRMAALLLEGATTADLATAEQISHRRVNSLLDRAGLPRLRRPRHRLIVARIRDIDVDLIDELAAEIGVPRSEVVSRVVLSVTIGGRSSMRRHLGKLAW